MLIADLSHSLPYKLVHTHLPTFEPTFMQTLNTQIYEVKDAFFYACLLVLQFFMINFCFFSLYLIHVPSLSFVPFISFSLIYLFLIHFYLFNLSLSHFFIFSSSEFCLSHFVKSLFLSPHAFYLNFCCLLVVFIEWWRLKQSLNDEFAKCRRRLRLWRRPAPVHAQTREQERSHDTYTHSQVTIFFKQKCWPIPGADVINNCYSSVAVQC